MILAHYYQESEIQDLADFVGDSLDLSRAAQKSTADIILFAGVHFMAEGAKILNPSRKVLIPDLRAGCSLSDSCPPQAFAQFKAAHPDHFVVSYINCSAGIKALSDVICTSTNAAPAVTPEVMLPSLPASTAVDGVRNAERPTTRPTGREEGSR